MKLFWLAGVVVLMIPAHFSFAQVISEIMFDPEGSDSGNEWIEIYNDTENTLDMQIIKFREQETNHRIKIFSGATAIDSGEYAIIADNPENLNFASSISVFDSTFSLNNTGESLSLVVGDKVVFEETYSVPESFIAGASLHLVSGKYSLGDPTPGGIFQGSSISAVPGASDSSPFSSKTEVSVQTYSKPFYSGSLDVASRGFVGVPHQLEFEVFYEKENKVSKLRSGTFEISFGDGDTSALETLAPIAHTYQYPGTYIVSASFIKGVFDTEPVVFMEKAIVVREPGLEILKEDGEFFLAYSGSGTFLLENFVLASNLKSHTFGSNVKLAQGGKIPIGTKIGGSARVGKIMLISPGLAVSAEYPSKTKKSSVKVSAKSEDKTSGTITLPEQAPEKIFTQTESLPNNKKPISTSGAWRLVGVLGLALGALMYGRNKKIKTTQLEDLPKDEQQLLEEQEAKFKKEAEKYSIFDDKESLVCGPKKS